MHGLSTIVSMNDKAAEKARQEKHWNSPEVKEKMEKDKKYGEIMRSFPPLTGSIEDKTKQSMKNHMLARLKAGFND